LTYDDDAGFDGSSTLVACCGAGGEYNYNPIAACGFPGATACADPSRAVNWDGIENTNSSQLCMNRSLCSAPPSDFSHVW